MIKEKLYWKIHTADLLKEIMLNKECVVFKIPLLTFGDILLDIAKRSAELNDTKLLLLCSRLTLYDCADPHHKDYEPNLFKELEKRLKKEK